jgi:hypothetical protein
MGKRNTKRRSNRRSNRRIKRRSKRRSYHKVIRGGTHTDILEFILNYIMYTARGQTWTIKYNEAEKLLEDITDDNLTNILIFILNYIKEQTDKDGATMDMRISLDQHLQAVTNKSGYDHNPILNFILNYIMTETSPGNNYYDNATPRRQKKLDEHNDTASRYLHGYF